MMIGKRYAKRERLRSQASIHVNQKQKDLQKDLKDDAFMTEPMFKTGGF